MEQELDQLVPEVRWNAPCAPRDLAEFLAEHQEIPHQDYLEFMKTHNGGEGPAGRESYIVIWPLHDAIESTADYGVPEFAPGLLLFATDGGDRAYAFDTFGAGWPIVRASLSSLSRDEMTRIASTFSEFLKLLAADQLY